MRRVARSLFAVMLASAPAAASAASWCAQPIDAHEWGVQVFTPSGGQRATSPAMPPYFHTAPDPKAAPLGPPVRGLAPDNGIRLLPVLQFYAAPGSTSAIPLGVEVGFAQGDATAWYPQVDRRTSAADAHSAPAQAARAALLKSRAAPVALDMQTPPLPPADPTQQLAWDALTLTAAPAHPAAADRTPWVARLRANAAALWVNGAKESERFVFYEAKTSEQPPLKLEPGPTKIAGKHHLTIRNVSAFAVHDVFLIHREGKRVQVFMAPAIPAGATAGLLLEDHPGSYEAARAALRALLVEEAELKGDPECVMDRRPAVPVETATGHTLRPDEVDALLEVWAARFFDAEGTTLVYREDERSLDAAMPLSIYTDMLHHVRLHRLGLGLVEGLTLPE